MTLAPLGPALGPLIVEDDAPAPVSRLGMKYAPRDKPAETEQARSARRRGNIAATRAKNIAVLDFETDPFDDVRREAIFPFVACLYSLNFEPVVIWDENPTTFVDKVIAAIEALDDVYTVYAHNGGKFDFIFLLHRLRGGVSFKGRGLMLARIGQHELRDSFHIIPEKLAAYRKDAFDYSKLTKKRRNKHREEILAYLLADCRYLLEIVLAFVAGFGLKLSIGQAALSRLGQVGYAVERIGEHTDAFLRNYYFGGRVECLSGPGRWVARAGEPFRLYDVNSMYPYVMATLQHPIGRDFDVNKGQPTERTCFVDVTCTNNGALIARDENGMTTASIRHGRFFTTIWEYNVAVKYGLITNVKINHCLDYSKRTDFANFVMPLYENRLTTKALLATLEPDSAEYNDAKRNDIFYKLLLNNCYGKFAQNPRKFREHYLTAIGERPPEDDAGFPDLPDVENAKLGYAIWSRPLEKLRFHNVATAASITGAARAVLLEAIMNSVNPIYCDTDSLICQELRGVDIHKTTLGAWDIEKEITEIIVLGKKLYAYRTTKGAVVCRQKGTSGGTWEQFEAMLSGGTVLFKARAPTLTRAGTQAYVDRSVRATASPANALLLDYIANRKADLHGQH